MLVKPPLCRGCPLYQSGRGFSHNEGSGSSKVLLIGEALGENEAIEGLPFRPFAQAGSMLQRTINDLGMRRDEFAITNIVRCRPPNNLLEGQSYEMEAISRCRTYLRETIHTYSPRVIVALGGVPLKALTGLFGRKKNISTMRGYVLWSEEFSLPIVPTLHPSFIARGNKNMLGTFARDVLKAVKIAKGELIEGRDYYLNPQRDYENEYNLSATVGDINAALLYLKKNPSLSLAYDIETVDSIKEEDETEISREVREITQFQVSWQKGQALVLPRENYSTNTFFSAIKAFMDLPNEKLDFNGWHFDVPTLRENNVRVGKTLDVMTMFRHWQPDVPSSLQNVASYFGFPFPWKHLSGDNLPFYGAADVDSLQWIYPNLKLLMQREGLW